MSAPTSSIHIANLALDRLGQESVTDIDTPTTTTEDIVARHYVATRREILRKYIFNFAKKYVVLTEDTVKTPAFGFGTAYVLPTDFVRLLALGDVTINNDTPAYLYDLSEGYIFTDSDSGTSGNVNLTYIFDATDVAKYDALFTRLLVLQLAANMAYKFTLKPSLIAGILQELQDVALSAAAVAGQEKPPRRIQRSRIRDSRRMGGRNRDNRYV